MNRLLAVVTATAALLVPLGAAAASAQAEPTTPLRPAEIKRGPNPQVPYVKGTTIIDGDRRIKVNAGRIGLHGTAGPSAYIVGASSASGENRRLLRVAADGTTRVLLRADLRALSTVLVADDGARIAYLSAEGRRKSTVKVLSAVTGGLQYQRSFSGWTSLHDVDGRRLLATVWGNNGPRTLIWRLGGTNRTVVFKDAYTGDLSANRVAFYSKDPYQGGCSVLTRISRPADRIWRSCRDRIEPASPDWSRLMTVGLLDDGLGSRAITMRTGTGRALRTFTVDGWFDLSEWEDNRTILVVTHGEHWTATIRCTASSCNRASKLTRTVWP
ncbi:hypothetical protein [Nocardioides speluncae]|uniref:hypothetical protein n=1 Tax=Nocardioides speluncae TaxID=2670337 RepID=UPI000D696406|nr:hypothetical protein [Nocardioides speluncae]